MAGSGSSLLGGDGLGGNPARANPDQSLPESQAYSEEMDPVETQQELTRISHYPSHRFKSTRKWMIRNGLGNDDPVYSEPAVGLEVSRRFQELRRDARREAMMFASPKMEVGGAQKGVRDRPGGSKGELSRGAGRQHVGFKSNTTPARKPT